MFDQKRWSISHLKFKGYYANVPAWIKTTEVAYYHDLIAALEEASGEDLSHFKIPPDRLKPKVVSMRPGGYRGGPGAVNYSSESYCDNNFFQGQLDALNEYLKTIAPKPAQPTNKYEQLPDWQLEELMVNRGIKPKRELVNGREEWVAPREYIIAALVKQDAPPPPIHSTTYNVFDSNFIQGSPGASISANIGLQKEEFKNLIDGINQLLQSVDFKPETKDQIRIDTETIQLHINSPRPNTSIIRESLNSLKTTLANTAGSLVASGIVSTIHLLLSKL